MRAWSRAVGLLALTLAACNAASLGPSPGAASSSTPAGPEIEVPTGAWTTTITEADARAAGLTGAGEIAENTGVFTTTFASDGTWTTSQVTSAPIRWPVFRGTYRATAPGMLELVTTFPPDYAGDVFTVAWTRDADGLHFALRTPDDPLLRMNLETHPWQPKA